MRQIVAGISGITLIKSKLDDLHIRISTLFYQSLYGICHIAKIFCNDLTMSKSVRKRTEQINSRSFFPPSVFCCLISIWNCIILIESAEMVNSYNIIQTEAISNSFYPPFITGVTMHFPIVQRISPELTCCRKSIRRAPCNLCRAVLLIQFEQPRICPGICTVHCYIDRNIADNLNAFFICICFQFHPLLTEFELHVFLKFNFKIHFFSVIIQSILPAQTDIFCPFAPRNTAETLLHCHKKCIVLEPPCLFFLEFAEFCIHINITAFISLSQKDHSSLI